MSQLQRITIQSSQLQQGQISFTPQQQHYLLRVLRLREGDKFIAMDGMGKWWLAQVAGEQGQVLEALQVETELPISITLMVALPKGNGFDDIVRCCTELGVACIVPILSDRTLLNPSPQKLERWGRIAAEAAEQSERSFVPTILEPIAFSTAINECNTHQRFICEARGNYPYLAKVINNLSGEIAIATGPEGGWTDQEIAIAQEAKFQPISLGRRILRAVTAPIVAVSLIAAACEV
ncbi:16S rRNA (uracil(1498)-N(3))-methyltransferase [Anabaena cylindrica UHCC 0172]|uniref:16S rRNA (uracil(1498)-N(3))-methyltransferase n=1 Tax=Anabaena cylindrica TaxID=1165 RepID=UPI002B1F8A69|nr:16S rRNA (uracil(1498)-N(3))-methyltransferase [Anabaena cylindrica]MEA5553689.1 16S rRNA (uracil(1498)-N(3))-methyltransferase [Anabaena cylindrica UHCC 0172]